MCACVHIAWHTCEGQRVTWGSLPRGRMQALRLGSKHLYLLSPHQPSCRTLDASLVFVFSWCWSANPESVCTQPAELVPPAWCLCFYLLVEMQTLFVSRARLLLQMHVAGYLAPFSSEPICGNFALQNGRLGWGHGSVSCQNTWLAYTKPGFHP